ncbi:pantoate--beta-alanine ligase [Acidocella sp. KAb 2-4]|uniref:pantoate--beta-alanine ligase n=1 Tax=Acidocella sp. KAb 2-4 TaxID=2885158 RepID=UPI001D07BB19|nr:pantoate--beta-alanine ligase [Acidocella sp. KAb 2-4]MCB5943141.1 pantoate--beta-alanine ligase [Acidocella sp. KAb 2-4]
MMIARTLEELRAAREALGPVGFVPTMGALHAGHLHLVATAKAAGLPVAASIFVNPTQFGPKEDFARYPRDEAGDLDKLERAGCALAWLPGVGEMYPPHHATSIHVNGPAAHWEGASRPGHFSGVATVVAKLFGQVRPEAAYFGEKDWQQVQVVSRMVADLGLPVRIVPVPTVREADGLALSSRNRYLTEAERKGAPALYKALTQAAEQIMAGKEVAAILHLTRQSLAQAGMVPDYVALVHAHTLEPIAGLAQPARLIAAAKLGAVRLLDNIPVG